MMTLTVSLQEWSPACVEVTMQPGSDLEATQSETKAYHVLLDALVQAQQRMGGHPRIDAQDEDRLTMGATVNPQLVEPGPA